MIDQLKRGDYILAIDKANNAWHLFKMVEHVDNMGIETILISVSSTSKIYKNLINKAIYLSHIYFEATDLFYCKKFNHKPNDSEIMAVIL